MSKLTVVLATYNHGNQIAEFLGSIPGVHNYSIVVSDGGSTDDTVEKLKAWVEVTGHRDFALLESSKRLWEGENVRRAMRLINTEFFLKCDPDVVLVPEIFDLLRYFNHEEVAAILPTQNGWNLKWWRQIDYQNDPKAKEIEVLLGTCFFGRTEHFSEVDWWKSHYPYGVNEWHVAYALRSRGRKILFDCTSSVVHYHNNLKLPEEVAARLSDSWAKFGDDYSIESTVKDSRGIPYGWRSLAHNKKFYQ